MQRRKYAVQALLTYVGACTTECERGRMYDCTGCYCADAKYRVHNAPKWHWTFRNTPSAFNLYITIRVAISVIGTATGTQEMVSCLGGEGSEWFIWFVCTIRSSVPILKQLRNALCYNLIVTCTGFNKLHKFPKRKQNDSLPTLRSSGL